MSASYQLDVPPSDVDNSPAITNASGDGLSDEDPESDYQSCDSYSSESNAEYQAGEHEEDGKFKILQWNYIDEKWEPIQASDMHDSVKLLKTSTEWISAIALKEFRAATFDSVERCFDALAVLSETVGDATTRWWRKRLSDPEHDKSAADYFFGIHALVVLITESSSFRPDIDWWRLRALYIPNQGMYHFSFASNLFEGRFVVDVSLDRRSKDLAAVMRIALPYFREMKARLDTLSKNVGYSDSATILGPSDLAGLTTCLDIAESVAKLVPVFGDVLEGICGILRKTVQAAENARSARNECRALAEHITFVMLAILQEIGPESTLSGADINRICDLRETIKIVNSRVQSFSKLGRLKYFASRGRINTEIMDLRAQIDNARIAFNIRSDISTTRLLTDFTNMQRRLASRVDDLCEGQKTTHHMLRTILVKVQGHSGDAYVDEEGRRGP